MDTATSIQIFNVLVVAGTVLVSAGAAFASARLGSRRAAEEAAATWRQLAEARERELAEIREDVRRLRDDLETVKDDKRQLRKLNATLINENGKLRQRVNALEATVQMLSRQVRCDHVTRCMSLADGVLADDEAPAGGAGSKHRGDQPEQALGGPRGGAE